MISNAVAIIPESEKLERVASAFNEHIDRPLKTQNMPAGGASRSVVPAHAASGIPSHRTSMSSPARYTPPLYSRQATPDFYMISSPSPRSVSSGSLSAFEERNSPGMPESTADGFENVNVYDVVQKDEERSLQLNRILNTLRPHARTLFHYKKTMEKQMQDIAPLMNDLSQTAAARMQSRGSVISRLDISLNSKKEKVGAQMAALREQLHKLENVRDRMDKINYNAHTLEWYNTSSREKYPHLLEQFHNMEREMAQINRDIPRLIQDVDATIVKNTEYLASLWGGLLEWM